MSQYRKSAFAKPAGEKRNLSREADDFASRELHLLAKGGVAQARRHLEGVMPRTPERERILRRPDLPDTLLYLPGPARNAGIKAILEYHEAFEKLAVAFNGLPPPDKRVLVPRGTTLLRPDGDHAEPKNLYVYWNDVGVGLDARERVQAWEQELERAGDAFDLIRPSADKSEWRSYALSVQQAEHLTRTKLAIENFIEKELLGKDSLSDNLYAVRDTASIQRQAERAAAAFNETFDKALENGDRGIIKALTNFLFVFAEHGQPALAIFIRQYGGELNIP